MKEMNKKPTMGTAAKNSSQQSSAMHDELPRSRRGSVASAPAGLSAGPSGSLLALGNSMRWKGAGSPSGPFAREDPTHEDPNVAASDSECVPDDQATRGKEDAKSDRPNGAGVSPVVPRLRGVPLQQCGDPLPQNRYDSMPSDNTDDLMTSLSLTMSRSPSRNTSPTRARRHDEGYASPAQRQSFHEDRGSSSRSASPPNRFGRRLDDEDDRKQPFSGFEDDRKPPYAGHDQESETSSYGAGVGLEDNPRGCRRGEESELVRQLRVERQQLARELEMERASREKRERQIERRTRKETLKEFGISPPSARSVRSESPQSPRFPGSPRSARSSQSGRSADPAHHAPRNRGEPAGHPRPYRGAAALARRGRERARAAAERPSPFRSAAGAGSPSAAGPPPFRREAAVPVPGAPSSYGQTSGSPIRQRRETQNRVSPTQTREDLQRAIEVQMGIPEATGPRGIEPAPGPTEVWPPTSSSSDPPSADPTPRNPPPAPRAAAHSPERAIALAAATRAPLQRNGPPQFKGRGTESGSFLNGLEPPPDLDGSNHSVDSYQPSPQRHR